ncbi:FecR family protein [Sunxiuqinia sp. sy24]|uniref:FecR family protein n=1 Tax=Sunxiuqinia sp. sy24 TaxID=3461495 RepID=UPI004045E7EC
MKTWNNNTNRADEVLADLDRLNNRLEIPYSRSKTDVWAAMETQLETVPQVKPIRLYSRPAFRLAMAASILLVVGLVGLMRFYTLDVISNPGQQLVVDLPDGSAVHLSAVSEVSYHPYWWRFSRELSFSGEAFFEVEKGSRFSVKSEKASTIVLGTSFNIFARDQSYRVACQTGKVKVVGQADGSVVILTANEKAELKAGNGFEIQRQINFKSEAAWINDEFNFRGKPLKEVLEEVERQYGVHIQGKDLLNHGTYDASISGHMVRSELNAEAILEMICTIYNLKFEKVNPNEYRISRNE